MSTKDTRSRILEAAGAAFAEHGFRRTTIRGICQRAGANLASVNYHFGDKQRLYRQVLRYAHDFAVSQRPLPEWPPGTAPEQKLRDFVHITLNRMLSVEHLPWHHRLMQREILRPSGAMLELVEDYLRPNFQTLLAILDELVPAGTPMPKRRQLGLSIIGQCSFYRMHFFSGSSRGLLHMLVPEAEL
ncbi:MAG: CerR family C-terminal domain-containing protein, partial [Pirellulaceae bacterium]